MLIDQASCRCPRNNIGYPIQKGILDPQLKAAMFRILTATRKIGKKCGVYYKDSNSTRKFAEQGYDMLVAVMDYTPIQHITRDELSFTKGDLKLDGASFFFFFY